MEICKKYVSSGTWSKPRQCGRPVKENGLCGIHAAAERRKEANYRRWELEAEQAEERREAAKPIIQAFKDASGGEAYYHSEGWLRVESAALSKLLGDHSTDSKNSWS